MDSMLGRGEDILRSFFEKHSTDTILYYRNGKGYPYRPATLYEIEMKIGLEAVYEDNALYFTQHIIMGEVDDRVNEVVQGEKLMTSIYLSFPVPICASIAKSIGVINDFTSYSPEYDAETKRYIVRIKSMCILVEPGEYFLNVHCDSGNAGYPFITSKSIRVIEKKGVDLTQFNVVIADVDENLPTELHSKFLDAFNATYPTMYKHFNIDGSVPRTIGVKFSNSYAAPASSSDATIWYNTHWACNCPNDIDTLIHELATIISYYEGAMPEWFFDGFADYCRYIYGIHPKGDTWLPAKWYPNQYYKSLYDSRNNCCKHQENSRFLVWLNVVYGAPNKIDILYEILKMIKQGTYSQTDWDEEKPFETLIGHSLDELWHIYSNSDYELDYGENYKNILTALAPERLMYHFE